MTTEAQRSLFQRYRWPVAAVAGGLSALGYARHRLQMSALFAPDRFPSGQWNPRTFGLDVDDCWFTTEDGVDLHGWWAPHPDAGGTILYCHGNSGSIARQVGVVRRLLGLRMNVLAFDYRGYGRSGGSPSERGLYRDVRAAHRYLVDRLGRPPSEIVLLGHSLGGAVAIDAALDCEVAGIIAQSTFTDLRAAARAVHPRLPLHLVASPGFRSIDKIGRLEVPVLVIHGDADGKLPVGLGRQLYLAASEPKELYIVEGAGHNDVHLRGGRPYVDRLERFARLCLAPAAA